MIPIRTVGVYFNQAEILKKQHSCSRFRAEVLHEAEPQILKLYQNDHLCELPDLTRERNAIWYEETIIPLIEALESRGERNLILCVRNGDSIRDLPEDASVEIPVAVSKRGLAPHLVGDCPRFLKGLFTAVKESDRLAIEAARHKSYEYALQSLVINPLVPSLQSAKRFLDTIIKEEALELH
jgi:6-phospho-beta-glucosidase